MKIWEGHSQLLKFWVKTILNIKSIIRWCRTDPSRVTPRSPVLCYRFCRVCYPPSQHLHLWGDGQWALSRSPGFPGIRAHFQGRQSPPVLPSSGRHACPGAAAFPALPGTAGLEGKFFSSKIALFFNKPFLPYLQFLGEFSSQSSFFCYSLSCCVQSWPGPKLHSYFQLPLASLCLLLSSVYLTG